MEDQPDIELEWESRIIRENLDEALSHADVTQVTEAITNIFSKMDISRIAKTLLKNL